MTAVRDRILTPQATVPDGNLRAILDPDAAPIGTYGAELEVVAATSRPVRREIRGSGMIAHAVVVLLAVEDGDLAAAATRRDSIVTDLILRLEADRSLGNAASADGSQTVSRVEWLVDYQDARDGDTLAAFATLTFTVETDLIR